MGAELRKAREHRKEMSQKEKSIPAAWRTSSQTLRRQFAQHEKEFMEQQAEIDAAQAPPATSSTPSAYTHKVVCIVHLSDIKLKLTLTEKLVERPLADAVIRPFLGAYNRKAISNAPDLGPFPADITLEMIDRAVLDGAEELSPTLERPCGELFGAAMHDVQLFFKEQPPSKRVAPISETTAVLKGLKPY